MQISSNLVNKFIASTYLGSRKQGRTLPHAILKFHWGNKRKWIIHIVSFSCLNAFIFFCAWKVGSCHWAPSHARPERGKEHRTLFAVGTQWSNWLYWAATNTRNTTSWLLWRKREWWKLLQWPMLPATLRFIATGLNLERWCFQKRWCPLMRTIDDLKKSK